MVFCMWLLSLSITFSRFILLIHISILYSFYGRIVFCRMDIFHCVYLLTIWWILGCFQLLTVTNNDAMNYWCTSFCLNICFQIFVCDMVTVCLTFWNTPKMLHHFTFYSDLRIFSFPWIYLPKVTSVFNWLFLLKETVNLLNNTFSIYKILTFLKFECIFQ